MENSLFINTEDTVKTLEQAFRLLNSNGLLQSDKWLAQAVLCKLEKDWLPVERWLVYDLLIRYRNRLLTHGISLDSIGRPPVVSEQAKAQYQQSRQPRIEQAPKPREHKASIVDFKQGKFILSFEWREPLYKAVKALPTARWRPDLDKAWTLDSRSTIAKPLRAFVDEWKFELSIDAQTALDFLLTLPLPVEDQANYKPMGAIGMSASKKELVIHAKNSGFVEVKMREVYGARWLKTHNYWSAPLESIDELLETFPDFRRSPEIENYIASLNVSWPEVEIPDLSQPVAQDRYLFGYQKEDIIEMARARFILNGNVMGLGKTLEALIAARIVSAGKIPIIVICPAHLTDNWEEEAEMVGMQVSIYSWAAELPEPANQFILIADEGHYAQNMDAQRTKRYLALALRRECVGCFVLTGTPIKNGRPLELLPHLKAVRHPLGRRPKYFIDRYCAGEDEASNLDELNFRLTQTDALDKYSKRALIRREKDILNLPPKTRELRFVKMSQEGLEAYQKKFFELQQAYRQAQGKITGHNALVMMTHLRHAASYGKVDMAVEIAKEYLSKGHQVVIFTEFVGPCGKIAEKLQAGLVCGDVTKREIREVKRRFQEGYLKVICGTFKKMGCGHTLAKGTVTILVDRPWTPGDAEQGEDRCHRLGTVSPVHSIWLQATQTDMKVDAILLNKAGRIEIIMKGKKKQFKTGARLNLHEMAKEMAQMLFA